MKAKTLLIPLLGSLVLLGGCNQTTEIKDDIKEEETTETENNNEEENAKVIKNINVSADESLELKSESQYSMKDFYFLEMVPVFSDGHIDHFTRPIYQYQTMSEVVKEGFYQFTINATNKKAGDLYFNIDIDIDKGLEDAFRIEVYNEAKNKSVIYSFKEMESITQGQLDLNGDNELDKDMMGNPITYTTGEESYHVEKMNNTPFTQVEQDEEMSLRVTVYFDGFYLDNSNTNQALYKLDLKLEIKDN